MRRLVREARGYRLGTTVKKEEWVEAKGVLPSGSTKRKREREIGRSRRKQSEEDNV